MGEKWRFQIKIAGAVIIVLLAIWVIVHFWFRPGPTQLTLPQVTVQAVETKTIPVTETVWGSVIALPNHDVQLMPLVSGKVLNIFVHKGEWVDPGQVIAELDPRILAAQSQQAKGAMAAAQWTYQKAHNGSRPQEIKQAQDNVAQSQASLQVAKDTLTRTQNLYAEKIAPRKAVEAAEAQFKTAEAQLNTAKQQLQLAKLGPRVEDRNIALSQYDQARAAYQQSQLQLMYTQLKAPIAGRVDEILASIGEILDTTKPVVRIINLSPVQVKGSIQANQIGNVKVGQPVVIDGPEGSHFGLNGTVQYIGSALDPTVNGFPVFIEVPNKAEKLKIGMLVQCTITSGYHPHALVIPKAALIPEPETAHAFYVYTVLNNVIKKQPVSVGEELDNLVEVTSGLNPQSEVVVNGGYGLADGTQVQVKVQR